MFCRLFVSLIRKGVGHVPKKSWRWGDSLDQCSGEARKHGDVKGVLFFGGGAVCFMPFRGTCLHQVAEYIKPLKIIL